MAHWAEINENNIVLRVVATDNNDPNGDEGYRWLVDNLGGNWIKTSYNAIAGKRKDPKTGEILNEPGFRKNYAALGYFWDENRDAFIPPKPSAIIPDPNNEGSIIEVIWILNETTCNWEIS